MAMQMLSYSRRCARAIFSALVITLATGLSACSSKNPLFEDPPATPAYKQPAPPVTDAKSPTEKPVAPAEPQAAPSTSKPQTTLTIPKLDQPEQSTMQRAVGLFRPYRIDIQQGNFVSSEMVRQLREGMTREQVRFLLGSPMLTDMFHAERWDYLFRLQRANGQLLANRVTVFFKDNRVVRFESTELPSEIEYLKHIVTPNAKPKAKPDVPPGGKNTDKPANN